VIDAFASLPHYAEHLLPVWEALPEGARGTFWKAGPYMADQPGSNLPNGRLRAVGAATPGNLVMVASAGDTQQLPGRRFVLVEHGAGQTYEGIRSRSYSGSHGWDDAVLFLTPNETVAGRWRARYPAARAVAVGCPRLDFWHRNRAARPMTVAVTFHWDNPLLPETRWAFPHFKEGLQQLRDDCAALGYELIGHGHPRAWGMLSRWWGAFGITPAERWHMIAGCEALIGDNTSALPEFASLGKPVVWMNSPKYRRDVHHGGRFWEWPAGQPQADGPGELRGALVRALYGEGEESRRRMVRSIYCATDGHAAERAAAAILEVL